MRLSQVEVGRPVRIVRIGGSPVLKRRLRDMGIVRGEVVKIEHVAPLGDPIDLSVKGAYISIRKEEADFIEVEPV